ncbi:hypothetical protein ACFQGA_05635 [Marinobacter koreensis]|uniref:hypothetical protein n=1 Tax=Marinobacter koreensis TaxID=335974 RepID=UPI003614B174
MADTHDPLHLLHGLRQHHEHRHFPIHREAIALIGFEGFVIGDDVFRIDERPELLRQLRFAGFRLGSHNNL